MCGIHLACVQTSTIAFVLKARIQLKMWVKFHSDDELYSNRWSVSVGRYLRAKIQPIRSVDRWVLNFHALVTTN